MIHQMPGGQPPVVPQKPTSNGIEITNVTEGETVHQVQKDNLFGYTILHGRLI